MLLLLKRGLQLLAFAKSQILGTFFFIFSKTFARTKKTHTLKFENIDKLSIICGRVCPPFFRNVAPLHFYLHFYTNQNDAMSKEKHSKQSSQLCWLQGFQKILYLKQIHQLLSTAGVVFQGGICLSTSPQKKIPSEDMLSLDFEDMLS